MCVATYDLYKPKIKHYAFRFMSIEMYGTLPRPNLVGVQVEGGVAHIGTILYNSHPIIYSYLPTSTSYIPILSS